MARSLCNCPLCAQAGVLQWKQHRKPQEWKRSRKKETVHALRQESKKILSEPS